MAELTSITPYPNHYLIYTRKSTDDANNQKNSIAYQKIECAKLAKLRHLPIAPIDQPGFCTAGIISERHTGFKEDDNFTIADNGLVTFRIERPKFHKLVECLYKGYFKGAIFLCWDRASRNKSDNSIIEKLIKRGIDLHFTDTNYDETSSGRLHMDIDGTFAQHYSRVISEKVTNTIHKLKNEGVWTNLAPIGYLNMGSSKNKPIDPERAPLVKALFEKYAETTWTLSELAKWANEQGLTQPPRRRKRTDSEILADEEVKIPKVCRPIAPNGLHRILTNSFYIGKIRNSNGALINSLSHEPLISEELFYRVQDILRRRKVSVHYIEKPYFPYRGKLRCATCSRVYTPYDQKGISYYSSRCVQGCSNTLRNINTNFIERIVGRKIQSLILTENLRRELDEALQDDKQYLEENRARIEVETSWQLAKLKEELSYLHNNKLSLLQVGAYSIQEYRLTEQSLEAKISQLTAKIEETHGTEQEIIESTIQLSELVKSVYFQYCYAISSEKSQLIDLIFSELRICQNSQYLQCKNGFQVLEMASISLGGPKTWISELAIRKGEIKQSIQELQKFLNTLQKDKPSL